MDLATSERAAAYVNLRYGCERGYALLSNLTVDLERELGPYDEAARKHCESCELILNRIPTYIDIVSSFDNFQETTLVERLERLLHDVQGQLLKPLETASRSTPDQAQTIIEDLVDECRSLAGRAKFLTFEAENEIAKIDGTAPAPRKGAAAPPECGGSRVSAAAPLRSDQRRKGVNSAS